MQNHQVEIEKEKTASKWPKAQLVSFSCSSALISLTTPRMAIALPFFILLSLYSLFFTPSSYSQSQLLDTNYYMQECPRFNQIMDDTTYYKQISFPATLRIFLHDCLVEGCDASVLISSTLFNQAERDADINLSLPGDGFDVVVRAKTALELACPGVVSCADILAVATRNLVAMVGGPYYPVKLGRKDGLVSNVSAVEGNIPHPAMPLTQIINIFESRGFSVQEMVALSGAHTIGFSHCKEFTSDIYNYRGASQSDPSYHPRFAAALRNACADYQENPALSVFNDVMSPNKFDNMYFQSLPKGLGLLSSDRAMSSDPRTRPYVELYAKDQDAFFKAFEQAMQKLGEYGIKTGEAGEIRRRCDAFNHRF